MLDFWLFNQTSILLTTSLHRSFFAFLVESIPQQLNQQQDPHPVSGITEEHRWTEKTWVRELQKQLKPTDGIKTGWGHYERTFTPTSLPEVTVSYPRFEASPTKPEEYCQQVFYITIVPSWIGLQVNPLWGIKMPTALGWSEVTGEAALAWILSRNHIMSSIPARLMGKPSPKGEQSILTLTMAMLFFLISKQMGKQSNSLFIALMKLLFRLLIDYLGGSAVSYFLKIWGFHIFCWTFPNESGGVWPPAKAELI